MSVVLALLKQSLRSHSAFVRSHDAVKLWQNRLLHPYRPEFHYMRGPGPKWREKHGDARAMAVNTRKLQGE